MYFPQYVFFERTQDTLVSAIGAAFQYVTKPALLTGLETTYERDWLTLTLSYVHGQFLKEHADSLRAMPKVPPLRLRLQVLRAKRAFQPYLETALYAPQRRAYNGLSYRNTHAWLCADKWRPTAKAPRLNAHPGHYEPPECPLPVASKHFPPVGKRGHLCAGSQLLCPNGRPPLKGNPYSYPVLAQFLHSLSRGYYLPIR